MGLTLVGCLSHDEARALTDEVKADAQALWEKMLRLYEGLAHTALGYDSWGDYYEAEFGQSGGRGYQLLRSAALMRVLDAECTSVHRPATEGVARELAPLRDDPEELGATWDETVARHGPDPSAQQVRQVRDEREAVREAVWIESPGTDIRFARIEGAADSLKTLPAWKKLKWPTECGDIETMDVALDWLCAEMPKARKVWRAHKAAWKAQEKSRHRSGLRAVA